METDKQSTPEQGQFLEELKKFQEEHQRLSVLFSITRNISPELQLDKLLFLIMDEVKKALNADRCTVFLLDEDRHELWSKVAHGEKEIRFPSHLGIAGHVATTGEVLNIPDAYADARFNRDIDKKTGYHTRNMLTFPMRNKRAEIIGVFQVLNKLDGPFTTEDEELLDAISAISATQIENAQLYEQQKKTFNSFVETLASTIDARDPLTAGHSKRIALYSDEIAKIVNMSPQKREVLRFAAMLHDYGKIAVREAVLCKNGKLTEEEYHHIQSHPAFTKSILEKINFTKELQDLPKIAASHHEKMDGSGYPCGLKNGEIPPEGRILAVVDVFDALTSKRHYRDRMEFVKVMEILENASGTHFDKVFVDAFKRIHLDRLITILEDDSLEKVSNQDLSYLANYTVNDVLEVLRKGPAFDEEYRLVELFTKYYRREYLKSSEQVDSKSV
ncbi:MAG: GAF domain-containing protein [candidate division KSB1 bacterium]|nr:GAF domain-containing protein [candidate division KSB1 bacterium]